MRFKKHIIGILLSLGLIPCYAQTIEMAFPAFAGKTYEFIIFQGDASIKAIEGTIPQNGLFQLVIPQEYAPYTGMCRWLITNTAEGGGLDMAISGHGFKVTCLSDKPDEGNIQWEGYDAVNELNRLYRLQKVIIDKYETMGNATKLYDSQHPLYAAFQKEKEVQANAYEQFYRDLKENNNYNARFLPIVNLVEGIPQKLTDDYEQRAKYVNEYITQELNFDHLYTSGHWTGIIQNWVEIHTQVLDDKEGFVRDFNIIGEGMGDPKKYTDFVGKATYYLTQLGKDDFIAAITPTVLNSGKITSYEGKTMQVYVKSMTGMQAPDLAITEHVGALADHNHKTVILKSRELATGQYDKTLLVFYQSGCGSCEALMQQLPQQYERLKSIGVRLITLSADENEQVFSNTASQYPWPDKYCDYQGMAGDNFKNYAIQGTPTLILLDKDGRIQQRSAHLDGVLSHL